MYPMCPRANFGIIAILSALAISGCASNPDVRSLSSEQRARFTSMDVVRGPIIRPHTIVGSVEGLSCVRSTFRAAFDNRYVVTEGEAIEGVKLRAALLDADAVVNVVCKTSGVDWANNCWSSIVCVGNAVRYKQ
jgi:uncharacterized protein YbjQ (UPF0145 family)